MELDERYRFQHRYILGKTGVGKSTTLLALMRGDLERGDGLFYIDPHGGDADRLLAHVPPSRRTDVILFDPSDIAHPAPINLFEGVAPDWRPFVASSVVDTFKSVWGYDRLSTPVMDQYLYNSAAALLDAPDGTLMGIKLMLTRDGFRERVLGHVCDPIVRDFWERDYAAMPERERRETARSTLNKIGMLLADPRIRNTIGYPRSAIDIDWVLAEGKVLIARLPQGRLGLQKTAMLGALLLARVHAAALMRGEGGRPFHVYLDEAHHFGTGTLIEMLSGIRKFGVSLTLCHQYIDQLSAPLREAVLGAVGTKIVLRVGLADAEALRHEFPEDRIHFTVAELRPFQARVSSPYGLAFIRQTPRPPEGGSPAEADRIRRYSRRHHTRARRKVERYIHRLLTEPERGTRAGRR